MNKHLLITSLVLTTALTGCLSTESRLNTTNTDQSAFDDNVPNCLFRDFKTPAPAWTCGKKLDEYTVSAHAYSKAGSEAEATAIARTKLAAQIRTDVTSKKEIRSSAAGNTERNKFDSVDIHTVNEMLVNTRAVFSLADPAGGVHVLVVAEESVFESLLDSSQKRNSNETLSVNTLAVE